MKEIEETQIIKKMSHVHGSEELILLKCPYYQRNPQSQRNPYQNSNDIFYRNRKKPLQLV